MSNEKLEKVIGDLFTTCLVDCPECDEEIDLFQLSKFTDDGYIHRELMGNDEWGHKDWNESVCCPDCGKEFLIGRIVY